MLSPRAQHFLSLSLSLCAFSLYGQQNTIDSLTQKKVSIENAANFKETDTTYIKTLYLLARTYVYKNRDSVKDLASKSLRISQKINYSKGIAGSQMALGAADIFEGKFEKGYQKTKRAKDLAQQVGADTVYFHAVNLLGLGNYMQRDFPKTYEIYQQGIEIAKKKKYLDWELTYTMNLATTFSIIKDYDQALLYYERCLELAEENNEKLQKAEIESNLAYLYWKTKEYVKAKQYANKTIPVFQELGFGAWESFAIITLGGVALEEDDIEEALINYNRALEILKTLKDSKRETDAFLGLSEAYVLKNDLSKAQAFANNAEQTAKSIGYVEGLMRASEILYQIFSEKQKPEQAIKYLKIEQRLSDSIQLAENTSRFLMMEAENKFKREQELAEQENERKINNRNIIIYISILLLIALLSIALLIRKNYLNQKRVNNELKMINEAKDKVFFVIGHDLKSPINTLQELLELYKDEEISEKDIAKITPILKENVDYNSFMLNNLFIWAKSQMNGVKAFPEKVNLLGELKNVNSQLKGDLKKKNIALKIQVEENHQVEFDVQQLRIVLRNLFSNAIKFTPKGGEIVVTSHRKNDSIELSIVDNGIGISAKTIEAFDNNATIESDLGTEKERGTGLGLLISKELVTLNNGSLDIYKRSNKGTRVKLIFSE